MVLSKVESLPMRVGLASMSQSGGVAKPTIKSGRAMLMLFEEKIESLVERVPSELVDTTDEGIAAFEAAVQPLMDLVINPPEGKNASDVLFAVEDACLQKLDPGKIIMSFALVYSLCIFKGENYTEKETLRDCITRAHKQVLNDFISP